MNILTDTLPKTVQIAGKSYAINTDFRAGVAFEIMLQTGEEDAAKILSAFFPDGFPIAEPEDIISAIELFYCCGALPEKKAQTTNEKKQAYSFTIDGSAIFADFWNYYNIDLSQEGLHWWAFRSLLECLPEKSEFKQRIYYRTCDLKGLSKKERERILKIRSQIEIKNNSSGKVTLEERNAKMLEYMKKRREEIKKGGAVDG